MKLYARLRPGVSGKAAEQETLALAARLRELRPDHVRSGDWMLVQSRAAVAGMVLVDAAHEGLRVGIRGGKTIRLGDGAKARIFAHRTRRRALRTSQRGERGAASRPPENKLKHTRNPLAGTASVHRATKASARECDKA